MRSVRCILSCQVTKFIIVIMIDSVFIFCLFFVLFLSCYLLVSYLCVDKFKNPGTRFSLLAGVSLLYLLVIFLFRYEVMDVFLFSSAGEYLIKRIDFYWIDSDHGQYPFFPFLIFLHAGLVLLRDFVGGLLFTGYLKLVLSIALGYIAWLVYRRYSFQDALIFLLSPITFCVVLIHAQVDIILIAFLVASLGFYTQNDSIVSITKSTLLYALSVASKTWSILLLPLLFFYRKSLASFVVLVGGTGIVLLGLMFGYTRFVFGSSISTVAASLGSPGGPMSVWGISLLISRFIPLVELLEDNRLIYTALIVGILSLLVRKLPDLMEAVLYFIIGLYVLLPNWGIQYLMWHYPFQVLVGYRFRLWDRIFYWFIIPIYLFMNYLNIVTETSTFPSWSVLGTGLCVWCYFVYRLVDRLKMAWLSK